MKKNKAFTLIELVSVLVILAILALIVTPLVLNIIRKARTAADKRSIDAYGRSIELAVADYLLEKGTFPTSIDDLTIEYSGDRVVCETAGLQPDDTSVYLANCKVNGREVTGYTYGRVGAPIETYRTYEIGDEVTYNNVDYYVIKDSDETDSSVTLLKAEPLTTEEVNTYGGEGTAYNNNGYGFMSYYTSSTCMLYGDYSGCITDYEQSKVKYVVDAWKIDKVSAATSVRLITMDDLEDNLGYEQDPSIATQKVPSPTNTPTWVYDSNFSYWTMSQYDDSTISVGYVGINGVVGTFDVNSSGAVRPVIVLSKSVLN